MKEDIIEGRSCGDTSEVGICGGGRLWRREVVE